MRSDLHRKVLKAALDDVPFDGFTDAVLKRAGQKAGVAEDEMRAAFPHGPWSLVEQFSEWADGEMAFRMAGEEVGSVRAAVAKAVRARIEVLEPHREAVRRAIAFLALPPHAPLGAKLLAQTSDAIWRAIGDTSTDFNYYSKRAILSGVFGATLLYWLSDSSKDHAATWRFLDRRIAGVMRFEKVKLGVRRFAGYVPDPFKILGALRGLGLRP